MTSWYVLYYFAFSEVSSLVSQRSRVFCTARRRVLQVALVPISPNQLVCFWSLTTLAVQCACFSYALLTWQRLWRMAVTKMEAQRLSSCGGGFAALVMSPPRKAVFGGKLSVTPCLVETSICKQMLELTTIRKLGLPLKELAILAEWREAMRFILARPTLI